jgi:hypothetical protein
LKRGLEPNLFGTGRSDSVPGCQTIHPYAKILPTKTVDRKESFAPAKMAVKADSEDSRRNRSQSENVSFGLQKRQNVNQG